MNLTRAIYRDSLILFGIYLAAALFAFWPRYYSNPLVEPRLYVHLHGIALTLWMLMLAGQAYLIRTNRRPIHRQIGKLSYVVAPLVALSIVVITHGRFVELLTETGEISQRSLIAVARRLGYVILFLALYGLAILHRRTPATHARYMLCTVLPMTSPIFDRILAFFVIPIFDFRPWVFEGQVALELLTIPIIDIILIVLVIWDWRSNRRLDVFPLVLLGFLVHQAFAYSVPSTGTWRAFGEWFATLPIS